MSHICMCAVDLLQIFICLDFCTFFCMMTSVSIYCIFRDIGISYLTCQLRLLVVACLAFPMHDDNLLMMLWFVCVILCLLQVYDRNTQFSQMG